jgi:hypothetical protein
VQLRLSVLVAIDLARGSLSWKVLVSAQSEVNHGSTSGRFPVVVRHGAPRVVFSIWGLGLFEVGEIQ